MSGLCCFHSLLQLVLSLLLLGLAVAAKDDLAHSTQPSYYCSRIHNQLFGQQLQRHFGQRDCADNTDRLRSSPDLSTSPRSAPSERTNAPLPPSIAPDASWVPGQAQSIYVQLGYWYVAWGEGEDNYDTYTLLKVDGSSHQPVSNVTLNSTYSIVSLVGNSSHIFAQVNRGDEQAMVVMTFDADTLELVNEVTLSGLLMLSGVNTAGTLFVIARPWSNSATILDASTGKVVAELDGGTILWLGPAAFDATTDTVIVGSINDRSIYGIALNNSLLWTITPSSDQIAVVAFAVDPLGRCLYAFQLASVVGHPYAYSLCFVQYDLTTHMEVGRYDVANATALPGLPFSAGLVNGQMYFANTLDGSITLLSMQDDVQESTYLSRYPYLRNLMSVASLDGNTFTANTISPYMLFTISADGVVRRRTVIAPSDACDVNTASGQFNIDIDMHGNIVVALCSLGVRVYSPDHTLLHVVHTANNTVPTGVAVTPSGERVYVTFSPYPVEYAVPLVQLYDVETGKFVANFSNSESLGPTTIAVDATDDSLWATDQYNIYHWSTNTTLLATIEVDLVTFQLAVDSQHRRLVVPAWWVERADRLEWLSMADGQVVQQFLFPSRPAAGPVAVSKDGAVTVAVQRNNGAWYFFRTDNDSSTAAERSKHRQQPVEAQVVMR